MSVQASETHYCEPRIDGAEKYSAVEVGYPTEREELLMPHIDGFPEDKAATDSVYGWVPSQVIVDVIAKHGGIVEGELPRGIPYLKAD